MNRLCLVLSLAFFRIGRKCLYMLGNAVLNQAVLPRHLIVYKVCLKSNATERTARELVKL
jgi:hypothetical protein